MPRQRERKTNRGPSLQAAERAVAAVEAGEKIRRAAKIYGLCHVTLARYVRQKSQGAQLKVGYNPATRVFSEEDETVLASYLLKASAVFFGLTPLEVRKLAYQWAVKKNIKVPQKWLETEVAGVEWFSGFLKRNPELSIRHLSRQVSRGLRASTEQM